MNFSLTKPGHRKTPNTMILEISLAEINYYSKVALTFYALIPLAIAAMVMHKANNAYRLFALFLLISFASDFTGFCLYKLNPELFYSIKDFKYAVYSFFDAVFPLIFLWMINKNKKSFQRLIAFAIAFIIFLWCIEYLFQNPKFSQSVLFDFSYCILNSFIAAYCLLQLAEEANALTQSENFWFLSGIFFYFFCANFMMSLLKTKTGNDLWVLHNSIALISYALFTKAFLVLRKSLSKAL